ncbi:carbamate kinase [Acididesulfobacillus acetoxydans]|uniref:Carbamate kinase n=1 Tax=Acididesulfobacillus acetoxydans TaxID=1561005 RepID=A0A8S0W7M9_9FIRM|nr:carbamate kinase [Acididesulfobacillus acetoxydans]CAA7600949.1 carbamate kinase [Acididesulfobacillus acetoxydans]CEJ08895.1 Carbamate kinase [Acididesulfobacillus acetoxydans]
MMKSKAQQTLVLAFGGNAITKEGQKGSFSEQLENIEASCRQITGLALAGHHMVITHGNGPQVGSLLIKNELAKDIVPPMPLDVCGANTQGSLGYAIVQTLQNMLRKSGNPRELVALMTRSVVDPADPAFQNPTKPVGPFFTREQAEELIRLYAYHMREDSGRGWRRVVPSPRPVAILERSVIQGLVENGVIVVAVGGGGIPVSDKEGRYIGIEAVIDKDLAAERLAQDIKADVFAILTGVRKVCLDYRKPGQKDLDVLRASEATEYLAQGQFPSGSMGPKIEAAVHFVEHSGNPVIITDFEHVQAALNGQDGTRIIPD